MFDVYDRREGRFWSSARRDAWAAGLKLSIVPVLFRGATTSARLKKLVENSHSAFRDGPLEGVIVRCESGPWLAGRAKLVRADFTQQMDEHWRRRSLEWNQVEMASRHR